MRNNSKIGCFCKLSEDELVGTKAGGLAGAVVTMPSPGAGAVIGGIGGGIKGGVEGWKK